MCTCLHGACRFQTIGTSSQEVCECDKLYTGSQCAYRTGLLFFELPLACVLVFGVLIMAVRITATMEGKLRFPESTIDAFLFPRSFVPTERNVWWLKSYVGSWTGPTQKVIPLRKYSIVRRCLVVLVTALELLPIIQMGAVSFLPVVPWHKSSLLTAKYQRALLLHPLWAHLQANEYPEIIFYAAAVFVPVGWLLACVLGVKRFPLFKPQPKSSPPEDACTLMLRLYSDWALLPAMIALFLPFECVFVGYFPVEALYTIPAADPECFTLFRGGHIALSFSMIVAYALVSSGIILQLNCESSFPQATLWTDARYTGIMHSLRAPLALGVVAFGNANPLALCLSSTLASLCILVLNAWMRPSLYSLVNWIRMFAAVLSCWCGIMGIAASLVDDPTQSTIYEAWSLGAIALTAITFSALFVQHTEDFRFKLTLARVKQPPSVRANDTNDKDSLPSKEDLTLKSGHFASNLSFSPTIATVRPLRLGVRKTKRSLSAKTLVSTD